MMAVSDKGCVTAMREAIKQMVKQPIADSGARGRIVNISSAAGITAIRREATYAASKAAVTTLTKTVALGHAKDRYDFSSLEVFLNTNDCWYQHQRRLPRCRQDCSSEHELPRPGNYCGDA